MTTIKREVVKVAAGEKKVDLKGQAKAEIMEIVEYALAGAGYHIIDGTRAGMTKGTVIIEHKNCDVQLKPITPKAGVERYDLVKEI